MCDFYNSFLQDNSEIHFKVKMTTHLKKLKESYSQRQASHHEHIYLFLIRDFKILFKRLGSVGFLKQVIFYFNIF